MSFGTPDDLDMFERIRRGLSIPEMVDNPAVAADAGTEATGGAWSCAWVYSSLPVSMGSVPTHSIISASLPSHRPAARLMAST